MSDCADRRHNEAGGGRIVEYHTCAQVAIVLDSLVELVERGTWPGWAIRGKLRYVRPMSGAREKRTVGPRDSQYTRPSRSMLSVAVLR